MALIVNGNTVFVNELSHIEVKTTPANTIYRDGNIIIPDGWKYKDFRTVKAGDAWISQLTGYVLTAGEDSQADFIRIIVEPEPAKVIVPKTTLKEVSSTVSVEEIYGGDVEIPEGYEYAGIYKPALGNIYLAFDRSVTVRTIHSNIVEERGKGYRILLRKKDVS